MVDPIVIISPELVTHLFSPLSTSQLTLLGRVSRGWRVTIQNDSVLNRVIDLVNLDRPLSELETTEVVQRLALLSTHPKNEIYVSLDPFLERFLKTLDAKNASVQSFDDLMQATSNQYLNLIDAIFLGTRGSLHKLILEVGNELGSQGKSAIFGKTFIDGGWELVSKMDNLKELVFKIPFPISLESVGEDGKRFQITQERFRDGYQRFTDQYCKTILRKVIEFTGKGLTQFGFKTSSFIQRRNVRIFTQEDRDQLDGFTNFLDYLKEFKSTLKKLEVDCYGDAPLELVFDLAITCQALQSFHLDHRHHSLQPLKLSSFQKVASPSAFKVLALTLGNVKLDFESPSLLYWIGTSLEHFKLDLGYGHSDYTLSADVPVEFMTDLINSNQRLEKVELEKVGFKVPFNSLALYSVSLPKLRSLKLSSTYFIGYDLFGKSQLPVLEELSLDLTKVRNAKISSIEPIFERCCSNLKMVDVWDEHQERDETDYDDGEDEEEEEVEDGEESDDAGRSWVERQEKRNWIEHNQNYRESKQFTEEGSQDLLVFSRLKKISLYLCSDRLDFLIKKSRFSQLDELELYGISPFTLQNFLNHEVVQDPNLEKMCLKTIVGRDREITWKPIQPGQFSKLKSLSLCETFMMPKFFLQAQPQHLVEFFVFLHDLKVSPGLYDLENINCVMSVLRSNSATLQELELESDFKIDLTSNIETNHPHLQFDKLRGLTLRSCPLQLMNLFYKSCTMDNLSRLELNLNGKTEPNLEDSLTFLTTTSQTLTELKLSDLKCSQKQARRLENLRICFPKLRKIDLWRIPLDLVERFSQFDYPQMMEFSAPWYIHDEEIRKKVIRRKISTIDTLLSSNAPKLLSKSLYCSNSRCKCKDGK